MHLALLIQSVMLPGFLYPSVSRYLRKLTLSWKITMLRESPTEAIYLNLGPELKV